MRELKEVVDALTRPVMGYFTQTSDAGKVLKIHTAENDPLFDQLYAAVAPGSEAVAGSRSLASTRNLIDGDALFEHSKMAAAVGDWCRMVGVRPTRNPTKDLPAWFEKYKLTDSDPDWYRHELKRWKYIIGEILDKPRRFEVSLCPVCRNTTWINEEGDEKTYPILVEYKVPKHGESITPTAKCRAEGCEATWDTYEAIEELGDELKEISGNADEEVMTTV